MQSFLRQLKWLGIVAPLLYVLLLELLTLWLYPKVLDHLTSHLLHIGVFTVGAGIFCIVICRILASKSEMDRQIMLLQEHQRLARELHDDLAQLLAFLHLNLAAWDRELGPSEDSGLRRRVQELRLTTEGIYEKVREVICGRCLEEAPRGGLFSALRACAQEFTVRTGIPVRAELPSDEITPIPGPVATQLLRIVREALCNIYRHAGVGEAMISAEVTDNDLIVTVADNGRGFNPRTAPSPSRRGLQVMRERAELVGGSLSVTTAPGEGTRITVGVPLHREKPKWKDRSSSWWLTTTPSFGKD